MATALPDNDDLAWDLDSIINRDQASEFVMQFETTLCVYSGSVEQLYSNYSMYFPKETDRKLVILPNANAYHDTFSHIPPDSILETGLYIIPGELIGKEGLFLTNMLKNRKMGPKQVPFRLGMQSISKRRPAEDPFLPILAKGDLREFEERTPVLHLHRIKLAALESRSMLERKGIANVVNDKLQELFEIADG